MKTAEKPSEIIRIGKEAVQFYKDVAKFLEQKMGGYLRDEANTRRGIEAVAMRIKAMMESGESLDSFFGLED